MYEADIRGYFNHVNHPWLQRMVAHRIADPVILSLIGKWLKAGFMLGGVVTRTEGELHKAVRSARARQYLSAFRARSVVREEVQTACQGEAYLTRFADDFVVSFQYRRMRKSFRGSCGALRTINLELAEEKTRLLLFGRFVRRRANTERSRKLSSFWASSMYVERIARQVRGDPHPSEKSCRKFLARTNEWLRSICTGAAGPATTTDDHVAGLLPVLRAASLQAETRWVRHEVQLQWARTLRRHSQRHRLYWCYLKSRSWFELPYAETRHATV